MFLAICASGAPVSRADSSLPGATPNDTGRFDGPPSRQSFVRGPFQSIAAYCRQYRVRYVDPPKEEPAEVCREEGPGSLCEAAGGEAPRLATDGRGAIRRATLVRAGTESWGDYHLAVETAHGVYVHEETNLRYNGRGRHAHEIQELSVMDTPAGPMIILRATTAWWGNPMQIDAHSAHPDHESDDSTEWYRSGAVVLCGVERAGTLDCTRALPMATATGNVPCAPDCDFIPTDAWQEPDWELSLTIRARTFTLRPTKKSLPRPRRFQNLPFGVEAFIKDAPRAAGTHRLPNVR